VGKRCSAWIGAVRGEILRGTALAAQRIGDSLNPRRSR
jgi:hypothetical protein